MSEPSHIWCSGFAGLPWHQQNYTPHEWQRCPICGGSGRLWDVPLFPTQTKACHGCNGLGMVVRP